MRKTAHVGEDAPQVQNMAEDPDVVAVTSAPAYGEMDFPEERKAELKAAFDKAAKEGRVEHKDAHKLTFTAEERKEYGFGTFEEDLKATNEQCYDKGDMCWEDLEKRPGVLQ